MGWTPHTLAPSSQWAQALGPASPEPRAPPAEVVGWVPGSPGLSLPHPAWDMPQGSWAPGDGVCRGYPTPGLSHGPQSHGDSARLLRLEASPHPVTPMPSQDRELAALAKPHCVGVPGSLLEQESQPCPPVAVEVPGPWPARSMGQGRVAAGEGAPTALGLALTLACSLGLSVPAGLLCLKAGVGEGGLCRVPGAPASLHHLPRAPGVHPRTGAGGSSLVSAVD